MYIRRHYRIFLIMAVASLPLLFHFLRGEVILSYDTINLFYVIKRRYVEAWTRGEFPQWNPGLFTGYFQLASPATALFSPTTPLFYFLIPSVWAEELQLLFYGALSGVGFYAVTRELVGDRDIALISGIAYCAGGPLLSLTDRSSVFFAVSLYPWLYWFALRSLRKGQILDGAGIAFVTFMLLIHGDWVAAGLSTTCIVTFMSRARPTIIGYLALGFGLSAASLLPALADVSETSRAAGFTFEQTSYFSLHPLRLLTLLWPELWGQYYNHTFWGERLANGYHASRFWFHSLYVSLPVLFAAVLGLNRKRPWLIASLALVAVAISFGSHFMAHRLAFDAMSVYRKLRFPEKFILYPLFFIQAAALYGWQALNDTKKWRIFWSSVAGGHLAIAGASLMIDATGGTMAMARLIHLLLALLSFAGVWLASRSQWAAFIVALELVCFAPAQNWGRVEEFIDHNQFAAKISADPEHGRFLRDLRLDESPKALESLQPNTHLLVGLSSVFGYETSNPLRSERLSGPELFRHIEPWARVLNFNYVLTTQKPQEKNLAALFKADRLRITAADQASNTVLLRLPNPNQPFEVFFQYKLANDDESAVNAVEARGPGDPYLILETAPTWTTPSPDSPPPTLTLKTSRADVHEYQASSTTDFLLVERESFHPHWRALVDDVPTPLLRADFMSRALVVPRGAHTVTLRFNSPEFALGAMVSEISLAALLALLVFSAYRRFSANNKEFDDLGIL